MICPACAHADTRVLESRLSEAGETVRRRRECNECRERFTTFERVERPPIWVVKRDGDRQPFERAKLLRGLERACVKRPVQLDAIELIAVEVEAGFRADGLTEVPAAAIGDEALRRLRDLDGVAYVRFASVYRQFDDPNEFHAVLDRLEQKDS